MSSRRRRPAAPAASASWAICSGDRFDIERPKISRASTSSSGSAGTDEKVNFGLFAWPETTTVTVALPVVEVRRQIEIRHQRAGEA